MRDSRVLDSRVTRTIAAARVETIDPNHLFSSLPVFCREVLPYLHQVPIQPAPELPGIEAPRLVARQLQDTIGLRDQDVER